MAMLLGKPLFLGLSNENRPNTHYSLLNSYNIRLVTALCPPHKHPPLTLPCH